MEENRRVHRVGTVTGGIVMIIYGVLFLLHTIFPIIKYRFIFRLWPIILIILGLEILAGNAKWGYLGTGWRYLDMIAYCYIFS